MNGLLKPISYNKNEFELSSVNLDQNSNHDHTNNNKYHHNDTDHINGIDLPHHSHHDDHLSSSSPPIYSYNYLNQLLLFPKRFNELFLNEKSGDNLKKCNDSIYSKSKSILNPKSHEIYYKWFIDLAKILLSSRCHLEVTFYDDKINNSTSVTSNKNNIPSKSSKEVKVTRYQFTEIEFYLYSSETSHPDPYCHQRLIQKETSGYWYFHSAGSLDSNYRNGNYKGLDITFGFSPKIHKDFSFIPYSNFNEEDQSKSCQSNSRLATTCAQMTSVSSLPQSDILSPPSSSSLIENSLKEPLIGGILFRSMRKIGTSILSSHSSDLSQKINYSHHHNKKKKRKNSNNQNGPNSNFTSNEDPKFIEGPSKLVDEILLSSGCTSIPDLIEKCKRLEKNEGNIINDELLDDKETEDIYRKGRLNAFSPTSLLKLVLTDSDDDEHYLKDTSDHLEKDIKKSKSLVKGSQWNDKKVFATIDFQSKKVRKDEEPIVISCPRVGLSFKKVGQHHPVDDISFQYVFKPYRFIHPLFIDQIKKYKPLLSISLLYEPSFLVTLVNYLKSNIDDKDDHLMYYFKMMVKRYEPWISSMIHSKRQPLNRNQERKFSYRDKSLKMKDIIQLYLSWQSYCDNGSFNEIEYDKEMNKLNELLSEDNDKRS